MDNTTVNFTKQRLNISKKRIAVLLSILLVLMGSFWILSLPKANNRLDSANVIGQTNSNTLDTRTDVQSAKATAAINRDFIFDVKNDTGVSEGKIKYTFDNAEIRNEIVIKGEKATAVKGRTFLIINLKLKNDENHKIVFNSRDYVRLSVNGKTQEWLAPDIHNDPLEVQAISTKLTRLGFPINDTDRDIKLQVGEVDGEKTIINLNLK